MAVVRKGYLGAGADVGVGDGAREDSYCVVWATGMRSIEPSGSGAGCGLLSIERSIVGR